MLIGGFVLVGDSVEIEKVRDLAFFETADGFAFQRAYVELADIVMVLAPVFELVLALVWRKPVLEPFMQRGRKFPIGKQIGHDSLEQVEQRSVVLRPSRRAPGASLRLRR